MYGVIYMVVDFELPHMVIYFLLKKPPLFQWGKIEVVSITASFCKLKNYFVNWTNWPGEKNYKNPASKT